LRIAFVTFCETVISEPGPAYLALVEVFSTGPAALVRRWQASETFERMLRRIFEEAPQSAPISEMTARGIIGGVARLAYERVGSGRPEELRGLVDDVLAWTLTYHAPGVQPPQPQPRSDGDPGPPLGSEPPPRPPREIQEPLALDHRERILRAIGAIVSRAGYPAVTIPSIAATAGISHETFYEHFPNKDVAFLATFDALAERASSVIITAYQQADSWPEAMRAGIQAITDVVAEQPVFARLVFSEFLAAGPVARARATAVLDGMGALLQPGYAEAPDRRVPAIAAEAVMGALWTLIQHEVIHGRAADLPSQAPHLTYFVVAPFIGAEAAAKLVEAPMS
jgi:AcrR family transcriptional regulator